jgi:putative FmdB family regulatory protein
MPLYEYQCQACGRRLERIQKFSDPPLETCPHCGGKLEKLISSPAIQFKGSGWYITDYARKGESSNKDSGSSSSKAETDKSASSDKAEKQDKSDSPAKSATDSAPAAKDSTSSSSSTTPKKD